MIYCDWCDRAFFDGEAQTIRDLNGTEIPYHCGCFEAWELNETELAAVFHEDVATWRTNWKTFVRTYRDAQISH